jgi:hypothetical protein
MTEQRRAPAGILTNLQNNVRILTMFNAVIRLVR